MPAFLSIEAPSFFFFSVPCATRPRGSFFCSGIKDGFEDDCSQDMNGKERRVKLLTFGSLRRFSRTPSVREMLIFKTWVSVSRARYLRVPRNLIIGFCFSPKISSLNIKSKIRRTHTWTFMPKHSEKNGGYRKGRFGFSPTSRDVWLSGSVDLEVPWGDAGAWERALWPGCPRAEGHSRSSQ